MSPYARVTSSANHEMNEAVYLISPAASYMGLPFSRERSVATEYIY